METITDKMLNHHTMFFGSGSYTPKFGVKTVHATQKHDDHANHRNKNAAFKEWLHRVNRGDQLPRGAFFRGKKASKPFIVKDEAWLFMR
ncbi:hypothetical protein ABCL16_003396 [Vibrio parahaemolyticus]